MDIAIAAGIVCSRKLLILDFSFYVDLGTEPYLETLTLL